MADIGVSVAEPGLMNREPIGARGARTAYRAALPVLGLAATGDSPPGQPALDWLDRQLLDAYQRDFPVCAMPFAEMARRFHRQAGEVLQRLTGLRRRGVVSRIGPVFTPGRIDAGTLVAMAVPRARLDSVARWVHRHRAVHHVHEREHEFNLWFVLAAPNAGALYETLADIRRRTGLEVLDLRLERDYHVGLGFPPWRRLPSGRRTVAGMDSPGRYPPLDACDQRLVEIIRDGLSLTARPYAAVADRAGLSETQVVERLGRLLREGVVKHMGVVVRHHELGYRANALVAFDVPCTRVDIVGERLAQAAPVTGCYRRTRRAPNWPYNLYCTVHGRNRAEVIGWVDELLGETVRGVRRAVLFSRRRLHPRGGDGAPDTVPPQSERPAPGLYSKRRTGPKEDDDERYANSHARWNEETSPATVNRVCTERTHLREPYAMPSGCS
ncbi:MAG: hypothetical protein OXI15_15165 [Chromatiales bacterium]|nr:hypothetical protein [Chromatiales bacterium]